MGKAERDLKKEISSGQLADVMADLEAASGKPVPIEIDFDSFGPVQDGPMRNWEMIPHELKAIREKSLEFINADEECKALFQEKINGFRLGYVDYREGEISTRLNEGDGWVDIKVTNAQFTGGHELQRILESF
jgi:hypothetical protein